MGKAQRDQGFTGRLRLEQPRDGATLPGARCNCQWSDGLVLEDWKPLTPARWRRAYFAER